MNALEIDFALSGHPFTATSLRGVFSVAQDPPIFMEFPSACVINTVLSDYSGKHRLAIHQDSFELIEFFDSSDKTPQYH